MFTFGINWLPVQSVVRSGHFWYFALLLCPETLSWEKHQRRGEERRGEDFRQDIFICWMAGPGLTPGWMFDVFH